MWRTSSTSETRDRIVRALLRDQRGDPDEARRAVLLFLLWTRLVALWRHYWWWAPGEHDGLWSDLVSAFFDELREAPPADPTGGITRHLLWRTRDRTRDGYRRERRSKKRREFRRREGWRDKLGARADADEDGHDEAIDDVDFGDVPDAPGESGAGGTALAWETVVKALGRCLDDGIITKAEHAVLLGAVVHGHTLKDECRRLGRSYETIRKRIQRAGPALRRKVRGYLE